MKRVSRVQLANHIVESLEDKTTSRAQLIKEVAAYLIETRQTRDVDLLMKEVADVLESQYGIVEADVVSAFELDNSLRQQLQTILKRNAGAKTVNLNESLDPALIGGFIARTAQAEIDLSIKTQLSTLTR